MLAMNKVSINEGKTGERKGGEEQKKGLKERGKEVQSWI